MDEIVVERSRSLQKKKEIDYDALEKVIDYFLYFCLAILTIAIVFFGYVHSLQVNKFNPIIHYDNILPEEHCNKMIQLSELYAKSNGWTTQRHKNYPTTDIPVYKLQEERNVSFKDLEGIDSSQDFIANLNKTVETKIFPLIRQHFSLLPTDQVRFRDFFIVKYDADHPTSQSNLAIHLDGSTVSFNIALNSYVESDEQLKHTKPIEEEDETDLTAIQQTTFTGGGTRFILSPKAVMNNKGSLVIHPSKLYHEGVPITSGKRYIIVGFVNAVPINYWERNYFRHFGRFSQCLNVTYFDHEGILRGK